MPAAHRSCRVDDHHRAIGILKGMAPGKTAEDKAIGGWLFE
jgi:hypothetical protein